MRLLILAVLIYFAYRVFKSWLGVQMPPPEGEPERRGGEIDDVMVKDPLCEAYFPRRDGVPLSYGGQQLLFCSKECRDRFIAMQSNRPS